MINAPVGADRQGRGIWGNGGGFDGYINTNKNRHFNAFKFL